MYYTTGMNVFHPIDKKLKVNCYICTNQTIKASKTMEIETPERKKIHQGRNMKRWRQIMGVTQMDIAELFDTTQQAVSKMEDKEELEPEILEKVAERIKIPVEVMKNHEPDNAVSSIVNTFNVNDTGVASGGNNEHYHYYINCTFNPIEKLSELYERLLEAEREKNKK